MRAPRQAFRAEYIRFFRGGSCDGGTADLIESLSRAVEKELVSVNALLISDYAKGVCTPEGLRHVIAAAREQGVPVAVDPARIADYERYRGATLVKPNRREAELVTGKAIHSPVDALEAGRTLVQWYGFEAVVVTLDGDGMAVVTADGLAERVPTRPRQVSDITGAGDMALAVLGLCLANKWISQRVEKSKIQRVQEAEGLDDWMGLRQAVELANVAAGLEIERVGVVPVTREEIAKAVRLAPKTARTAGCGRGEGVRPKLVTMDGMARLAAEYRREGKTVVLTNGCFDLLHVGHVTYLEEAAKLADVLVVAVNSDASVRRPGKGPERPIVGERDRAAMLAALACVHHVLLFDEATPHRLLQAIRPDVLVKGGTYTVDQVVGREIVERYGGRVCVTGMQPGVSTRSGTTWMQWFLCQHPEIHVHGQLPTFDWHTGWQWYRLLVEAAQLARRSNEQIGYEVPHYAGSDEERCRRLFADFVRGYLCGFVPEKPRWGIKSLMWCLEPGIVEQVESLWPEARWVVCIRDPFLAVASEKNTFRPDADVRGAAYGWVKMCEFANSHDPRRTVVFQIDRAGGGGEQRIQSTGRVLACIGVSHTPETKRAASEFPVIHKAIPSDQRRFQFRDDDKKMLLDEVDGFGLWLRRMGY